MATLHSASAALQAVTLPADAGFAEFRAAARPLVQAGIPPHAVVWQTDTGTADLFGQAAAPPQVAEPAATAAADTAPRVPAGFVPLAQAVALHNDPGRFGLLYRLLWRLQHTPGLWSDTLDADRLQAEHMAREVRRDIHKMRAFVRFRPMPDADGLLHVAWFVPTHYITRANAGFFQRRFTGMRWALLTPQASLRWEPDPTLPAGGRLTTGPGASAADAPPADADEALWLTYYASIFNPARPKLSMMQREMPRKYWPLLPEARLIAPLASQAAERSAGMLAQPGTMPARRIRPLAPAERRPEAPAGSLEDRKAALDACRRCPIGAHATQGVPGEGPLSASIMVVGEQPGDQEDLQGRPFVGPSGQLLDQALAQLGFPRQAFFVTNAVKHFKYELRGQRRIHKTPGQREALACQGWLAQELALVRPQAAVALGATAAQALLGAPVAVTRVRGQWLRSADGLPVLVTLHPAALLRGDPAERDAALAAWIDDLRALAPYL